MAKDYIELICDVLQRPLQCSLGRYYRVYAVAMETVIVLLSVCHHSYNHQLLA